MKAAETRRWHGAAERLSPLRRVLAGEFKGRVLQQSLAPMAVYDRIGGPALILAVPPGSDLPCLLTDRPQPDILLDFARRTSLAPSGSSGTWSSPQPGTRCTTPSTPMAATVTWCAPAN